MSKNFEILKKPLADVKDLNPMYSLVTVTSFYILLLNTQPLSQKKWRISESNRWPPACKAGALASWANPPSVIKYLNIIKNFKKK